MKKCCRTGAPPEPVDDGGGWVERLPGSLWLLILAGVVFLFAKGWLDDGIPGEDFAGNVAHVQELLDAAARHGTVGPWADRWFPGQPWTLVI